MLVNTSISSVLLLDKDEYSNLKLGIPLKRIKFKWRLSERISKRDLVERRVVFWETCGKYGVIAKYVYRLFTFRGILKYGTHSKWYVKKASMI